MFYLLFGLILLLFILFLTGRKSVHHEIIIHSDTETVWNVIINMDKYPNWNPVVELLEGTLIQGNQVKYLLTPDEDTAIEVRATVAQLTAEKILNHIVNPVHLIQIRKYMFLLSFKDISLLPNLLRF